MCAQGWAGEGLGAGAGMLMIRALLMRMSDNISNRGAEGRVGLPHQLVEYALVHTSVVDVLK